MADEIRTTDEYTDEDRDGWATALFAIAFGNFEQGPTPDYIREHARNALRIPPLPKDETGEQ